MVTFEQLNLPTSLQKAIDDLGYTTPTPIQAKAFPVVMSGRDVMGIAQTGTGKTYAYLLPILKQWKFAKTDVPRVLILVPTRELVVQVHEEIEKLTKYMSVRSLAVYGGVNINTQKKDIMLVLILLLELLVELWIWRWIMFYVLMNYRN